MAEENKEDKQSSISELGSAVRRLRSALETITEFKGQTLLGEYCNTDEAADRQHQIGANKAFEQCVRIAERALEENKDDLPNFYITIDSGWTAYRYPLKINNNHCIQGIYEQICEVFGVIPCKGERV